MKNKFFLIALIAALSLSTSCSKKKSSDSSPASSSASTETKSSDPIVANNSDAEGVKNNETKSSPSAPKTEIKTEPKTEIKDDGKSTSGTNDANGATNKNVDPTPSVPRCKSAIKKNVRPYCAECAAGQSYDMSVLINNEKNYSSGQVFPGSAAWSLGLLFGEGAVALDKIDFWTNDCSHSKLNTVQLQGSVDGKSYTTLGTLGNPGYSNGGSCNDNGVLDFTLTNSTDQSVKYKFYKVVFVQGITDVRLFEIDPYVCE